MPIWLFAAWKAHLFPLDEVRGLGRAAWGGEAVFEAAVAPWRSQRSSGELVQ